jgi:predicted Rossmann fold nucleotide-binding protein DprA/Smf involved in DNA uptake
MRPVTGIEWFELTLPAPTGETPLLGHAIGNRTLLDEPLLGLLASRACPAPVLIDTLDQVKTWVQSERVIVSGFHSPLEQQVLRSLLRRRGRAVKVLARGLPVHRPAPSEREALEDGRLMILTACPPEAKRVTRASALARNRLVRTLASECLIPYAAPGSLLAELMRQHWPHADPGDRLNPAMPPNSNAPLNSDT